LGLTLPNGQPVPAWAERAVAGAAAAIVAIGISSAVLVAGRGGRVRDDGLARSVASEVLGADGENALGGSVGLDGGATTPLPSAPDALASLGQSARSAAPALPASEPTSVAPETVTPAPVVTPPSEAPTTPSAPVEEAEPAVEVTVGVEGVLGLTVGDECTGVEIAGTVIGCAPATTGAPVEVIPGGSLLGALGL
jgi:hypothetical protein